MLQRTRVCGLKVFYEGRSGTKFTKGKVKAKFSPEQATKAQRGSRGITVLFL
jgi:hypothetical protein